MLVVLLAALATTQGENVILYVNHVFCYSTDLATILNEILCPFVFYNV